MINVKNRPLSTHMVCWSSFFDGGMVAPVASQILVNTGSGNSLIPTGNQQLHEPMLTYHKRVIIIISIFRLGCCPCPIQWDTLKNVLFLGTNKLVVAVSFISNRIQQLNNTRKKHFVDISKHLSVVTKEAMGLIKLATKKLPISKPLDS